MRSLVLILGLGFLPHAVFAQDVALLIGNRSYQTLDPVAGADGFESAGDALGETGAEVISATDADRPEMVAAIREFAQFGREAGGQAVVLVGRFGEVDGDAWFLPVEASGDDRIDTAEHGVPVSLLARIVSRAPGRAILVLGAADVRSLGQVDLPQGVTLAVTDPGSAVAFARDTLAVPGAAIADGLPDDARTGGFLPAGLTFLPDESGQPGAVPDPETAYWLLTRKRDEAGAYRAYLGRFPDGEHAAEAQERLDRYTETPEDRAERLEAELDLSREDRQAIQRDLTLLGYGTRGVDGIFGPGTRAAIVGWQEAQEREATGFLTREQVTALDGQGAERAAAVEAEERRRQEERNRADEALWSGMGSERSEAELSNYVDRFPDGLHAGEARRRLGEIRGARVAEEDAGERERERQIWSVVQQENSVQGYRTYIDAFPDGDYVSEARAAIDRLSPREVPQAGPGQSEENSLGLTPATRRAVEQRLDAMGLRPGTVDGTFDGQTREAIRRYQRAAGLRATGYVNQGTAVRLLADSIRGIVQ